MDSPMIGIAARPVRFTAELTCLMCGRNHGTLDGGSSWPPRGDALLHRPGDEQPMRVNGWWRLRCTTCSGALMTSEVTSQSARSGTDVDWRTASPRRGRPARRVLEGAEAPNVTPSASWHQSAAGIGESE
jgi:hypothetical protein